MNPLFAQKTLVCKEEWDEIVKSRDDGDEQDENEVEVVVEDECPRLIFGRFYRPRGLPAIRHRAAGLQSVPRLTRSLFALIKRSATK